MNICFEIKGPLDAEEAFKRLLSLGFYYIGDETSRPILSSRTTHLYAEIETKMVWESHNGFPPKDLGEIEVVRSNYSYVNHDIKESLLQIKRIIEDVLEKLY